MLKTIAMYAVSVLLIAFLINVKGPHARAETGAQVASSVGRPVIAVKGGAGCETEVGGQSIRLAPGQGIRTGDVWKNCRSYDGHPLIVFESSAPGNVRSESL